MQKKVAEHSDKGKGHRLVVAGGGTGGHLFPGIAIAQEFTSRDADNSVLFVNAGRPLEIEVLSGLGWPHKIINIEGIKGRGPWQQIKAASKIPAAMARAAGIVKRAKADLVLGVGGYSAGPVVAAARLMGIPTALHEQNRLPGLTNRILGQLVDRIYLSFTESGEHFTAGRVKFCGNPVRDEILQLAGDYQPESKSGPFTIFIVGGSQGASAINQAMVDALPLLKGEATMRCVHQTGPRDLRWVQEAYAEQGMDADARAFFTDMAARYQEADLMICRAGATTVAEITAVGLAALFVPFPLATDDHQTRNAQALTEVGAADMIEQQHLDGQSLAGMIRNYMEHRDRLVNMASKARALGRLDAAKVIVDDITARLASNRNREP